MTTLLWLRRDLRLDDNTALLAALARGGAVIPVYIHSPEEEGEAAPSGASAWWLDRSLAALALQLKALGSRLILRQGPTLAALQALLAETKATSVLWNRRYEPAVIARDSEVKKALRAAGCAADSSNAALLYEPMHVRNKSGDPYKVFTPFWRACLAMGEPAAPLAAPTHLPAPASWPQSLALDDLNLKPTIPWDAGLAETWTPGEAGATERLALFSRSIASAYVEQRDLPGIDGTSRLSPHLAFGELSPRRIWATLSGTKAAVRPGVGTGPAAYLRQLGWREFAYHLLYHFPATVREPLRPEFAAFPWVNDAASLRRWQQGKTGYPIVDAGMRQLWTTGWMHNRVRMIVGSFLVKDLMLPWQEGERWFWDTLVDADLANNALGWQWIAGCGADAAPYFRVFNPSAQGERFDANGAYVRHWVPELARLPLEYLHKPETAPPAVLREAGVSLGRTYPEPIVDHGAARLGALKAYETIKKTKALDA